jgi:EAL domain-containing protein (putative c-di-GMP-specific phosphodiesterase class I)/DNA-binding NarL/FixJ family response regulator
MQSAANSAADPGTSRPVVLVVEDDQGVRRLEAFILQSAGFEPVQAETAEGALRLLGSRPFAAVVLDVELPVSGGLMLLRAIRSEPSLATLPVVLLSRNDSVDDRVVGLRAGASDYLVKPFDPDELAARVEAQIRGAEAWRRVIDGQRREQGAVARALLDVNPEATPEVAAGLVCDELRNVRGITAAAVISFPVPGRAVPLAVRDLPMWGLAAGVPLPMTLALYLQIQAGTGAWIERFQHPHARITPSAQCDQSTPGVLACAPLAGEPDALGLLVLTTDGRGQLELPAGGDRFRMLSAAVDFADIASSLLVPALYDERRTTTRRVALDRVIRDRSFRSVFQPIVDLTDGAVVGYEALTRFTDGTSPQARFDQAIALERTIDLEMGAIEEAVAASYSLPAGAFLSVNVSPATVMGWDGLADALAEAGRDIVIELTEHEAVGDYEVLRMALGKINGARLSIDDAGAGFASLRHILSLDPSFVKLDHSWIAGIAGNPTRQAMVSSLAKFAAQTGCKLIAEGIEQEDELAILQELEVELGQGYLLGRPAPATAAMISTA